MAYQSPANHHLLKGLLSSTTSSLRGEFVLIQLEQASLFGERDSQKEWTDFSREVSHDILMKRNN